MLKRLALFGMVFMVLLLQMLPLSAQSQGIESEIFVTDPWGGRIETGARAIVGTSEIWIPADIVKWYTDDEFIINLIEKRVYVTIHTPKFQLETIKLDKLLNLGTTLSFPLKMIDGKPYVNMYRVDSLLGLKVVFHGKDQMLEIIPAFGQEREVPQINRSREPFATAGKINLVWDHVSNDSPNLAIERSIKGLDVISPTWFAVVNEEGLVFNKADSKYVADAHSKNYKVWALLSNSFDRELTKKILASDQAQENIIKQMVTYVSVYDLDGINVDFENIYDSDKDRFTAFIRKLGTALKEQNVVLSVDVTTPSRASFWSLCYDRKELALIADYIMVMTYDEHWRLSPISGSVASIGWVEKGLKATLAEVPEKKLLLGIPLYTREWEETTNDKGEISVKSRALSMAQADKQIADNQASVIWLEDKGQHYAEYTKDNKRYRIWLEDVTSIKLKAKLVHKYGLAGTALWRKGFEKEEIWDVLQDTIKKH